MKGKRLVGQLVLAFLLVALLPLGGLAWFYLQSFEQTLSRTVLQNISSIANKKSDQIDSFINERLADARAIAAQPQIRDALAVLDKPEGVPGTDLQRLENDLALLADRREYGDLLLISLEGRVLYSARGVLGQGKDLMGGMLEESGLATGFRQAMRSLHVDLTRFSPDPTRQGSVTAYLVAPVLEAERPVGALALRIDLATIAPVLSDRTGLGVTGETVLAMRDGDHARYTIRLDRKDGDPFEILVPLERAAPPMRSALLGRMGEGVTRDYAGVEIVAAWHYLPALGWGMVVKMDTAEAFAPLYAQQRLMRFALLFFMLASATGAWLLGRRFVRSEDIIAAQEARYRAVFGSMNDGVAIYRRSPVDEQFTVLDVNPAGERIAAVRRDDIVGKAAGEAFEGLEAAGILEAFRRVHRTGEMETVALTAYRDSRVDLWVENDVIRLPDGDILSVFKDVTARKAAEDAVRLYANVFEHAGEALVITDAENRVVAINPAFTRQTGYSLEEVVGRNPRMLASGHTPRETYQTLWANLAGSGYWQGELWHRSKSGEISPKWAAISVIRDAEGRVTHHLAGYTDISERKAAEQRIEHLAHHDSLTGLYNRFNLEIRLSQAIALSSREKCHLAVMFIDLDRFKVINDTLGHHVGDLLLVEVAKRLQDCVRASDIVARQGGDEFVVVMTGLAHPGDATPLATKLLDVLARPYEVENHRLHSTPSIGISIFPQDGADPDTLMRNADAAMYHAKEQGRHNLQYFTTALNDAATERLVIERGLREALDGGQFSLHYQPQVVAPAESGQPLAVSVEALIRWKHPTMGAVPPCRFIPVAEETGLIERIGQWVLDEACRQLATWRANAEGPQRIAINLSAQQLRNPDLVGQIADTLARHGLSGDDLELEVTETMAMSDPARAIAQLGALRELGVRLAIDDFGTGYSSLGYLKLLPIQVLKIDRAFVKDIGLDDSATKIVLATLRLAHSLDLEVVAEGVEEASQFEFLVQNECDYLQGYYFSPPKPADDLLAAPTDQLWSWPVPENTGQRD